MSLIDRLKKNSKSEFISELEESIFFKDKKFWPTKIPNLNVALSGNFNGGLSSGLLQIAGPSKHFKSSIALIIAEAYMNANSNSILLFYDSEFGSPVSYFKSFKIDTSRVLHTPITDIEMLKFDIMAQIKNLSRDDDVIILIDSIGNLASKKEVEDALNENSAADMTRAKALKSLWRMVTPHLTMKDIPLIAINHTYKEMALYPKDIVGGGTGGIYCANNIWIIGRSQEKDGDNLSGYKFTINIDKSRWVKEKSKVPITVRFDSGIGKWSGILELAVELGYVVKPSKGYYQMVDVDSGELIGKKFREKESREPGFWDTLLENKQFTTLVEKKYTLSNEEMDDE